MRVPAKGRPAALGRKPLRVELAAAVCNNPIARREASRDFSKSVIAGSQSEVYADIRAVPFDEGKLRSLGTDEGLNRNRETPALLTHDDIDLSKEILLQ